jgi:hypothetical protein
MPGWLTSVLEGEAEVEEETEPAEEASLGTPLEHLG